MNALPAKGDAKVSDEAAIKAARSAYDSLTTAPIQRLRQDVWVDSINVTLPVYPAIAAASLSI